MFHTNKVSKDEFYGWKAKHEKEYYQREFEQDLKIKCFENEVRKLSEHVFDEEHAQREFDNFFYKIILPKVGTILDKKDKHNEKMVFELQHRLEELDSNTVKKSNVSKYFGAVFGIIFAGGIGSTWNALYEMQTKLDSIPQLKLDVTELQNFQKNVDRKIFVIEGNIATLNENQKTSDSHIINNKNEVATMRQSIETNSFSISDIYSKLKKLLDPKM